MVIQTTVDYRTLYEQKADEVAQLNYKIASLTHQLDQLKKMIFGSRHERFVPSVTDDKPNLQLSLGLNAQTIAQCKITDATKISYTRTKTEETPIKVLDENKKGKTHQGYYWVYHNSKQKLVLFDYRKGRGREGPDHILKDYKGYLQTDGYVAYDDFDKRPDITLLHCMAHARRKFADALQNDKSRAEYALDMFQQLYAIERKIKDEALKNDPPKAEQLRQEKAVPILKTLKQWMTAEYPKVLPQSPIGIAIAYCLPRWDKLSIYTTEASLLIDN